MRCALLLCLCLATPAFAELPAAPPLTVRGDGLTAAAGGLSLPELTALGPVTVSFEVHGKRHSAVGVPLAKVLARFGVGPGPMSKAIGARRIPGRLQHRRADPGDGRDPEPLSAPPAAPRCRRSAPRRAAARRRLATRRARQAAAPAGTVNQNVAP